MVFFRLIVETHRRFRREGKEKKRNIDSRRGEILGNAEKKTERLTVKRGRKKKRRTIFLEMSRKRENDKWIFGLDRTSLPSPLKIYPESARDLMDGEARSCVENSRRENHPKTFPTVRNRVARRSTRRVRGGPFLPLFFYSLSSPSSLLPLPVHIVLLSPRPDRPDYLFSPCQNE